jgi:hypothetical protein
VSQGKEYSIAPFRAPISRCELKGKDDLGLIPPPHITQGLLMGSGGLGINLGIKG